MKKSKILVPALGILVLSTAASITGTVAWFTASSFVTVSGFNMKAETEQGLVIANETHAADADWSIATTASHNGKISNAQQAFVPTSTADMATWYHANAANADSAAHTGDYVSRTGNAITEKSSGSGVYQMNIAADPATNVQNIYLLNKFYIQSSSPSAIAGQDIYLTNLVLDGNEDSTELNMSLRLGVKMGSNVTIFGFGPAGVAGAGFTNSYHVGGSSSSTSATTTYVDSTHNDAQVVISGADGVTIPAYTTDGAGTNAGAPATAAALEISIYLYFEGEDENCKSSNITENIDDLQISFQLGNKVHN